MLSRSERIKLLIEGSGKSYQELEKLTGVKKSSLQRYASGATAKIPLTVIEKLAKAFHVSQNYLMGWEEAPIETVSGVLGSYELDETQAKLVALYDKIADKEGFIRFTERLSALSEEQQRFVFENLLQGR